MLLRVEHVAQGYAPAVWSVRGRGVENFENFLSFPKSEKRKPKKIAPPPLYSADLHFDSRCVVRARGLPWHVSDLDVAMFFAGLDIPP